MSLTKWYCTELYPTNAEDEMGIAGDFCVYKAADVEVVLEQCRTLAKHVVKFPYGHNANGCLEYREEVKREAQRLLKELEG